MSFIKAPRADELKVYNEKYGFNSTEEELTAYSELLQETVKSFQLLYELPEPVPPVKYLRDGGYRPEPAENKLNAWYQKCSIKGASSGKLHGKKVAIKDSVFLAGIPMMNGSRLLEGFIPEYDATVVTRMLDEGAEIVGKTTCEELCYSGGSFLTTYGPVRNPWNTNHSAGGSSSGSAVVVATGEVDLAIGGDQGGSIRFPASQCGIVGLKPTYGLVPYTGICAIDATVDHVGPMTKTVEDCALLLSVIAGLDSDNDARQPSTGFFVPDYVKELEKSVNGLKIGILKEAFGDPVAEDVKEVICKAINEIKRSGSFSSIEEVSAPHHQEASIAVMAAMLYAPNQLIDGSGYTTGLGGLLSSRLSEALCRGIKSESSSMSISLKCCTMFTAYMKEKFGMAPYVSTQTLILKHRKLYNKLFEDVDLLIMPTSTSTGPELPGANATIQDILHLSCLARFVPISQKGESNSEEIYRAIGSVNNTAPFNSSHHPALTLNAGFSEKNGLPVGLQIVGRLWQDDVVLRAGNTIEKILEPMQTRKL